MNQIITIGDSLTAGYPGPKVHSTGDIESTYQYWTAKELRKLPKFSDVNILNYGFLGDTSQGIYSRLLNILNSDNLENVILIIINGGGNDWGYKPINYSKTLENLLKSAKETTKKGIPILLTSISPFGDPSIIQQLKLIAIELQELIKKENTNKIFYYDWFNHLYDEHTKGLKKKYDSGDGEHLNKAGNKFLGKSIAEKVKEIM
jgi:lysophospholipase L1-like esterase